jgi:4-hydroxy-3-polyprenylbenzoate decarboxylase
MAYRNLREFLDTLAAAGELTRVKVAVDPLLEIAAITDRICKLPGGGPALFFEQVKGSSLPVVTNIFGSSRRIAMALEVTKLDDLASKMEALLAKLPAGSAREKSAALARFFDNHEFSPRSVTTAPCQEVVEQFPDLTSYPLLKNWPGDGLPGCEGRFITLPLVFSRDAASGRQNCGMYRVQLFDHGTAGIHWRTGSGGELHYQGYAASGERMPIAIAIGSDPAVIFAAALPLPDDLDEISFAGFLRNAPVELVKCRTSELMVPANAELVIEGFLEPGEMRREGAFGNHTGFYSTPELVPVLRVACITGRRQPVYPATVVGPPPMEDCYLAKAMERLLLPLLRLELPELVDINQPFEWIFHHSALVSIRKEFPGQARRAITSLWGQASLRSARLLVVVDADVDVQDLSQGAWRALNNVDWERDLMFAPPEIGNPTAELLPGRGRLAIDATRKLPGEGALASWPEELTMPREIVNLVKQRWKEYGF